MIKVITNKSRKLLAKHLAKHDPETLEFFTQMSNSFGKMESIGYEGPGSDILKEQLMEIRRQELQKAKEKLT